MATAPLTPPERLVGTVRRDPRPVVHQWLEELPATVARRLEDWHLTPERVLEPGGRRSLVVYVRQEDGTPATLRLPLPGRAAREAAALERWDGWGSVRLLRADVPEGALLLERLRGEISLRSLAEAKAVLEATGTLRRLWVEPGPEHPWETVAGRTDLEIDEIGAAVPLLPVAGPLLSEAADLRRALAADAPEEALLHGAFRQAKVLAGERVPWLAVGPDPVVGEHAYDLAALALDRFEDLLAGSGVAAAARRRVARLAEALDVDRDRLRGWTLFRAVHQAVREVVRGDVPRGEALLEFAGAL
ncbi:aminoglycoside phosphotransferase family protein [Streptomyces sp. NPDC059740]|uniref:aminoglycoside phosphotransferase family protein n=1 Tax=Streptomyces sp. NPDC059740 TaxID=3346926 RepID=UPI00364DD214